MLSKLHRLDVIALMYYVRNTDWRDVERMNTMWTDMSQSVNREEWTESHRLPFQYAGCHIFAGFLTKRKRKKKKEDKDKEAERLFFCHLALLQVHGWLNDTHSKLSLVIVRCPGRRMCNEGFNHRVVC